ncbi:MAG: DUF2330 domain-containing protein [Nitrospirae bacterium]|nr:DUF2330 domain-containing protein [Nitrospirota bacterium]
MQQLNDRYTWVLMCSVLVLLLNATTSYADGVYLPDRAIRKLPEIPSQRAIISHKDGVETLIVESAIKAEGQSFGWIIPLPSEPIEFRKVTTELLNVFSNNLEPEIIHENIAGSVSIFLLATSFFVILIFIRLRLSVLLAACFIFLFLAMLIGPKLGQKGMSRAPAGITTAVQGVEIMQHRDIGSYEVTVIKAAGTEDINTWLEQNEFATIPLAGISIIDDYIKHNWVFVATKLKRSAGGLSVPHPLLLKFPVSKPVYPMRLTALPGSDIFLRLFIVGDQKAILADSGNLPARHLVMEVADQFFAMQNKTPAEYPVFQGFAFKKLISHPFTEEIMWPGSIVTAFAGKVTPAQMTNDYILSFSAFEKFRRKYYSTGGAIAFVLPYALAFWCLGLLIAALVVARRGRFYVFMRIILPFFCLCLIGAGAAYSSLPITKVTTTSYFWTGSQRAMDQIRRFEEALNNYRNDTGSYPSTAHGLDALIRDPGVKRWDGPYLKQLRQEISNDPWNNPYHYQSPGQHVKRNRGTQAPDEQDEETYDLYSFGEDNEPGGAGPSEDITSWQ